MAESGVKTVLIVDDSPKAGEELRAIYEGLGLQVIGVLERALEVEAFYEEHRPDLISLDIIMPEMDGIECYFKLKEKHDEIRVIFVSALAHLFRNEKQKFSIHDSTVFDVNANDSN